MKIVFVLMFCLIASGCAVLEKAGLGCLKDVRDDVVDYIDDDISIEQLENTLTSCAATLNNLALVVDKAKLAAYIELDNPLSILSLVPGAERVARVEEVVKVLAALVNKDL